MTGWALPEGAFCGAGTAAASPPSAALCAPPELAPVELAPVEGAPVALPELTLCVPQPVSSRPVTDIAAAPMRAALRSLRWRLLTLGVLVMQLRCTATGHGFRAAGNDLGTAIIGGMRMIA